MLMGATPTGGPGSITVTAAVDVPPRHHRARDLLLHRAVRQLTPRRQRWSDLLYRPTWRHLHDYRKRAQELRWMLVLDRVS